jgi:ring-1,2-phenylacetyl-CoA epoxidase subunit PaaE
MGAFVIQLEFIPMKNPDKISMSALLSLLVTEIIPETPEAVTIKLASAKGGPVAYKAGQFLTFIFNIRGRTIRRSYSLSSAPESDAQLAITVKKVINGEISRWLIAHLKTGDLLTALPPAGRFTLDIKTSLQRNIFMIAAGSGITPVFSILKSILIKEQLSRVTLIYSNRDESSAIFFHQLNQLQELYKSRFDCIHIFSKPQDKKYIYKGHLNLWLLEELIRKHLTFEKTAAEFFICGPFSFMRMAETMIVFMGFDEQQIHKENFEIPGAEETIQIIPSMMDKTDKQVTFVKGDELFTYRAPYDQPVLNSALAQHVPLPYSCKAGFCGTCAVICRKGEIVMSTNYVLTDKDLREGWVLTCTGYPSSQEIVLELK